MSAIHTGQLERHPAPGPWAREYDVETSLTRLSGLMAEPAGGGEPRALVVALHGLGMHAGYFDITTAPGLSLLETGSSLGFRVWAPDRPGTRASIELDGERRLLRPQADLLLEALDAVIADGPIGAGVFVVGHSYGAKAALSMLARAGDRQFLGLDINSVGAAVGFGIDDTTANMRFLDVSGDKGPSWGPRSLYPPGTISRARLPMSASRPLPINETMIWGTDFAEFAPRVSVPVRVTFGDHERWWPIDEDEIQRMVEQFTGSPRVTVHFERDAGHNLSMGWAAASYHRAVFEFAQECIDEAGAQLDHAPRRA